MEQVILASRVRLARNYEDLPFDMAQKPDLAAMCDRSLYMVDGQFVHE